MTVGIRHAMARRRYRRALRNVRAWCAIAPGVTDAELEARAREMGAAVARCGIPANEAAANMARAADALRRASL